MNRSGGLVKKYRKIAGAQPGQVVHHKDGNPRNNDPDNLELMTPSQHSKLHMPKGKKLTRPKTTVCKGCKVEFLTGGANVKTRTYCSRECYQEHRSDPIGN